MTLPENGVQQLFAVTLATIAEQTTKVKESPLAGMPAFAGTVLILVSVVSWLLSQ